MQSPDILAVALYAGLNAVVYLWLTAHCGLTRRGRGIAIGDGGDPAMIRAMRGQANFVENVPLTLLLMLLMALMGAPLLVLHLFGIVLTVSRVLHALHFTAADAPGWSRRWGAVLTILVQVAATAGVVGHALWQLVAA